MVSSKSPKTMATLIDTMPDPAHQTSLTDYRHWLDRNAHAPHTVIDNTGPKPFALTIYRDPGAGARPLGRMIASYLNEVDPIAPARWASFDESALQEIAAHKTNRLDPGNERPGIARFPLTNQDGRQHTPIEQSILNLVSTGAFVLVDNEAHRTTLAHPRVFHVRLAGSDSPEAATTHFHLTVNTRRMSQHTAVRVIADSALEWAVQPLQSSGS
jgi:hypothetical protein